MLSNPKQCAVASENVSGSIGIKICMTCHGDERGGDKCERVIKQVRYEYSYSCPVPVEYEYEWAVPLASSLTE
eukprot:scaffold112935_cov19-Prasinocladus_malaysianus.AAC.1